MPDAHEGARGSDFADMRTKMRETAKWLTVSFGGLTAFLAAGAQVADVRGITGDARLFAGLWLGLAVTASLSAFVALVWVLIPFPAALELLAEAKPNREARSARDFLAQHPGLLNGQTIATILTGLESSRERHKEADDRHRQTKAEGDKAEMDAASAESKIWHDLGIRALDIASYLIVRRRLIIGVWVAAVGVLAATAGIFEFVATTPKHREDDDESRICINNCNQGATATSPFRAAKIATLLFDTASTSLDLSSPTLSANNRSQLLAARAACSQAGALIFVGSADARELVTMRAKSFRTNDGLAQRRAAAVRDLVACSAPVLTIISGPEVLQAHGPTEEAAMQRDRNVEIYMLGTTKQSEVKEPQP